MTTSRPTTRPARTAVLAVLAMAIALIGFEGYAQLSEKVEPRTISGTVVRFTTAPRGEVDGAVLNDDTVVHWPPHVGAKITDIVARKDKIRVTGHNETTPKGETVFEVQTIVNVRSGESVRVEDFPPPKGPKGPKGRKEKAKEDVRRSTDTKTVRGTVERFTKAPKGEVDGAVLEDGTVVHWAPHLEDRFKGIIAKGDRIKVTGWMETAPRGEKHLEVQSLTNLRTDTTRFREDGLPLPTAEKGADSRERRLKALEEQLERMQKEISRLRREK